MHDGYYKDNGLCVRECASYKWTDEHICSECPAAFNGVCQEQDKCPDLHFVYNGVCVLECPEQMYYSEEAGTCVDTCSTINPHKRFSVTSSSVIIYRSTCEARRTNAQC